MSELNASAVKKMKVTDLRSELVKRGLETKGLKAALVQRLLSALEEDKQVELAEEAKEEIKEVVEETMAVVVDAKQEETNIAEVSDEPPEDFMADDSGEPLQERAETEDVVAEGSKITDGNDSESKAEEPDVMEHETKGEEEAMNTDETISKHDSQDSILEQESEEKSEGVDISKDLDTSKDLQTSKDLDVSMNDLEPSKDLDISKDLETSKDPETSTDVDISKDLETSKDPETSADLDISKDLETSKDPETATDLDISEDLETSKDWETSKDLDISTDLDTSKDLEPKKSQPFLEVEEEKDETDPSSVVLSRYVSDLFFKVSPDGLTGNVITGEGFTYIWAGAKTTWGVNKGKVGFECKVIKNIDNDLPDTEEPKNGVRVGWSVAEAGLTLGEEGLSYGYENTGKSCTNSEFSDYGSEYTQGDVIGCYLDLDSDDEVSFSYTKNGEDLGVAFVLSKEELAEKVLYPHILIKNTECQINAGAQEEPWFPCKEGYTYLQQVGVDNLVEGPRPGKKKEDCEVLMMVGLPASGKTTWVNKHVAEGKEKNYNIIGTNSVMAKMKVNGEERKRSSENYDKLMEKATKCLRRIFELAPTMKRNYILDQTNVHPNAQKRKMESFAGFKRIAVVVCPKPDELEKRTKEKKEKKGFEVPEFALNDMKANFSLPRVGPLFNEVMFIEENEEESGRIVTEYKKNARSSSNRGSSYRRRDDHKGGSGRYHPYKRNDYGANRGSGNRDRRSGGRGGGGGSNYGRQHGGGHDRRNSGGHNKNYNRGNRSGGSNRGGGNFQKNYQPYQQSPRQPYAGYAAPQYSFPPQPAYPAGFQNPYQQPRAAYPAAAYQQQQAYYYQQQQAQQNYYQYGQAYQYPRRY